VRANARSRDLLFVLAETINHASVRDLIGEVRREMGGWVDRAGEVRAGIGCDNGDG
jgi:hypothetical protein